MSLCLSLDAISGVIGVLIALESQESRHDQFSVLRYLEMDVHIRDHAIFAVICFTTSFLPIADAESGDLGVDRWA